jgi:hypothetical protein
MIKTTKVIPAHLQKLSDLTKTVRDPVTGRIEWKRIEQEHPDVIAEATDNGRFTYKTIIDRLGYYLRRGEPKSPRAQARAASKVPWTPEEIAMVQSFQRYQLPDGRMDWPKIQSTDAWARLLTRHTDARIKGKYLYLREHGKMDASRAANKRDIAARADLSTRLTQIASKTHWTEDEDKPNPHLAMATAVKFCPYCGHDLQAHLRS